MRMAGSGESLGMRPAACKTDGFDYLRLAVAVLFWHSYAVCAPAGGSPFVVKFLARGILPLFFALSGFLITSSLKRLNTHRSSC